MEPVIRASRLAVGRTVLPVPGQAAAVPVVSAVALPARGEPVTTPTPELGALRRTIEQNLHELWQSQHRDAMAREREAARRDGEAEGLAEGRAASEAAARAAEQAMKQAEAERHERAKAVLQVLQRSHAEALAALRDEVGTLAFEAVCRIAGQRGASREFVLGIVETVCRGARATSGAKLRLHPRDLRLLAGDSSTLNLAGGVSLTLVADDTLAQGGCSVETEAGQFDGSLATQLQRLHALLTHSEPAA